MKNKWVQECEIADLCPARINAIKQLYFNEHRTDSPWFPAQRLQEHEAQQLDLQISHEEVGILNVEAEEFVIPVESFVQVEDAADSGMCSAQESGSVTPLLDQVCATLVNNTLQTVPPRRRVIRESRHSEFC